MILFLHNRYRHAGGEERAVEDLLWLVRERLGEDAELLERDSGHLDRRQAATGMLRGGLAPGEVAEAVRRTQARIVHAHNLHPAFGWRALAAARAAGARVVLHLHQYRLVCAVGVCFTEGEECTRCHGANTLPGIRHNCRGSRAESLLYATALAGWQRRLIGSVDAVVAPSSFAVGRLRELRAPVGPVTVLPHLVRAAPPRPGAGAGGYALVTARLAAEKGVEVAMEACRLLALPLVVAGDGPLRGELERRAGPHVRFLGRVEGAKLARLRHEAAVAVVPSRFAETFGLAAAEAMAAGLPVAASRVGALPELVPQAWLCEPGDAPGLARVIKALLVHREQAGAEALARVRAVAAPEVVAPALARLYDDVSLRTGP